MSESLVPSEVGVKRVAAKKLERGPDANEPYNSPRHRHPAILEQERSVTCVVRKLQWDERIVTSCCDSR